MKTSVYSIALPAVFLALAAPAAHARPPAAEPPPAASSALRVMCEGDDIGAEVTVNGKYKGECPLDMQVAPGILKLRVEKKGTTIERIFEQEIRMGDGVVKKVEVVMSSWIKDAKGCKFSNPSPSPNETITWTGGCKDGYGEGPGKMSWFVNGVYHSTEEGTYSAGNQQGHGIHTDKGGRFEGEFKDSKPHGHGIETKTNGDRYEGEFKNGKREGHGIETLVKGEHENEQYTGEFKEGKPNGYGRRILQKINRDGSFSPIHTEAGVFKDGKLLD